MIPIPETQAASSPATPPPPGQSQWVAVVLTIVGVAALLDAVVETMRAGSPARWSLAAAMIAVVAGVAWICRPGGRVFSRFRWRGELVGEFEEHANGGTTAIQGL